MPGYRVVAAWSGAAEVSRGGCCVVLQGCVLCGSCRACLGGAAISVVRQQTEFPVTYSQIRQSRATDLVNELSTSLVLCFTDCNTYSATEQ